MTSLPHIQYFLGANAPTGFYSLYQELITPETARAVYILKGGPGCGKSTLMRKLGEQMEGLGLETEYILCSGDPESLDALILPGLGVALVDGTAPHVIEPKYPGAVERYVNMGAYYDSQALFPLRQQIIDCMAGYKGCYQRAYRCLGASAQVFEDMRATLLTQSLSDKMAKRAQGILSRELPRKTQHQTGQVKQRFLGAMTHQGLLCQYDTALAQCSRIYQLSDSYGLAHELLIHLLTGMINGGYNVVACLDPMAPERLAHLLVPELELAFVSSCPGLPFPGQPHRHLRLDAAADAEVLRHSRPRLRFAKKISLALAQEGIESLVQAKAMHDELEAIYNPYVNFDLVDQLALELSQEILSF